MNRLARARHVLARRPWLYWLGVAALAAAAAWGAARGGAWVAAAGRGGGASGAVVVAPADLRPGDELAGHVEVRGRPGPMVPDGALPRVDGGAHARQHVSNGEILVRG